MSVIAKKKRVFIGLSLPEDSKNILGRLRMDIGDIRWVPKRNLHMTLRFIGGVDEVQLELLKTKLGDVKVTPFSLSLQHIGHFQKYILWVNTDLPKSLILLKEAIDGVVDTLGFEAESRPFVPHITLARIKKISQCRLEDFIKHCEHERLPSFEVNHFILYESNTEGGSSEYTPLVTFKLQ